LTLRLLSLSTLYPAPPRPGFGRFVRNQMEALARRGDWQVTVINPIGLPPLPAALLARTRYAALAGIPSIEAGEAITVHHPRFALLPGLSGRFNPALIAASVLPLARRLHAETPFDMVDAQFFYPDGPAAARIARDLGLPLAIKARGGDILHWGMQPAARAQIIAAGDQARVMLAVSAALARDMAGIGLDAGRITVHYTGLDHSRFYPRPRDEARAELNRRLPALALPAHGRIIASVGALIAIKGHALAIDALAQVPDDVVLVLAGTGPDQAALRAQAARLGLAERVILAGALGHDDLPLLLAASSAMVLASSREGIANAWIEALASGAPLVIPDVGGAREVIDSGVAGRLVERNAEAIAAGLNAVLAENADPAVVARIAERFSWDNNAARLAEIYRAAIG